MALKISCVAVFGFHEQAAQGKRMEKGAHCLRSKSNAFAILIVPAQSSPFSALHQHSLRCLNQSCSDAYWTLG